MMQRKQGQIPKDQLIMGLHAIREVLLHAPDRLLRVFTEEIQDQGRKSEILELCRKKRVPVGFLSFRALTDLAGSDSHQSFVAHVKGRDALSLKEFLGQERERSLVLMLDQIFDPHNLGALLRSAECFGVDAVIFSKNRGSDLTPVATKSSSGASELVPLIRVSNLAEAMSSLQKEGYEAVTTLIDEQAIALTEFKRADKMVLILGSEGEGVQPLIRKRADRSIYIPMQGKIDSLNVAQAAAVLLFALSKMPRTGLEPASP